MGAELELDLRPVQLLVPYFHPSFWLWSASRLNPLPVHSTHTLEDPLLGRALGKALWQRWTDTEKVCIQGPLRSVLRGISQGLAKMQLPSPPASGFPAVEPGKLHFHKQAQEILMYLQGWDPCLWGGLP